MINSNENTEVEMLKGKLTLTMLTISMVGCSSLIQTASITEAYEHFYAQDYKHTIQLITRAESINETPHEMKAELTYLKAQAHEGLGHQDIANTLYKYLAEQHQDSQFGYLASKKLNINL